ncbi:tyrosine-type recombinase/integrase [Chryseobacterium sp. APV1]|uniref:Tyrosine-type recombinase/integrase n=1 Tax=Chryseobacterium urinae TaxID=3058400 RepID=A0ABT8U2A1_9FLAO|nr:tyrosine-type recombinase/integrase [Chryseobacterium sp. APV1]MDO3425190.1 tyrosine-type recombinase/integrase [Chryseobacterium sp. APV1]
MKLKQVIDKYVSYRKALGEIFRMPSIYLQSFANKMGSSTPVETISKDEVEQFLYGNSKVVTGAWFSRYSALHGFYDYLLIRDYVKKSPLPTILPARPKGLSAYIYSNNELKSIFHAALTYSKRRSNISPYMVQTILFITYALGLRISETLSIKLGNIDMNNLVIALHGTKFYKSRLVTFNIQVKAVLSSFLKWRTDHNQPGFTDAELFLNDDNLPVHSACIEGIFGKIRAKAGVKRDDGGRYQPRIHDLRHTFAVNRLINCYKKGTDPQKYLPILSVYMGHAHYAQTSVYLTMTDALLQQANKRFESYLENIKS